MLAIRVQGEGGQVYNRDGVSYKVEGKIVRPPEKKQLREMSVTDF